MNALKRIARVAWIGADSLRKVLHLIVLLLLFSILLGALTPSTPPLLAGTALIIQPVGVLVEELDGDPFDRAVAEALDDVEPQTRLRDVVDALERARDDNRIAAVLLDLNSFGGGGLAKLERVAEALIDFRSSGKPVIATANFYSQPAYYLAAHADEVLMHPDGLFLPQGISLYTNYFGDAIDKLKVDWNVFRVGTYKSAVEPYTGMGMSDDSRFVRQRLADQLWSQYQEGISEARGLEPDALDDFAEDLLVHQSNFSGDIASAAVEFGFIDELVTRGELEDRMLAIATADEESQLGYRATGMGEYLAAVTLLEGPSQEEQNVAVIVASGNVLNGSQPPGTIGGDSTSRLLRQARLDDAISAVVLRIDTPGGSSFAAEQIRNEVEALRDAGKPVVASMSSVAASAGYWIAMGADTIVARESTITGSIGVFLMLPTVQRTMAELGVATDGVETTRWGGQFRLDRPLSPDSQQFLQAFVDKGYDDFISMVAMYRDLQKDVVDGVAQGQVWTGDDALTHGLIDAIGGLEAAIESAASLAALDTDSYGTVYLEQRLSPGEEFFLQILGSAARAGVNMSAFRPDSSPLATRALALLDDAFEPLIQFDDPVGMYSYCFCVAQ